jgi:hypothetical protein
MTREEAEAEMLEGYFDGLDPSSPPPGPNRSQSYCHGFANGHADRTHKSRGVFAQTLREQAEACIAADTMEVVYG